MVPPIRSRLFNSSAGSNASIAARATASRLINDVRDASTRAQLSVSRDWQITDLFNTAEQEPGIVFSNELLDETAAEMIGPAYKVEEPDDAEDANVIMQAADARMRGQPLQPFIPILRDMLRDPAIQRSTVAFLQRNADFQRYIAAAPPAAVSAPLAIGWPADDAPEGGSSEVGLGGLLERLSSRLMSAGQTALSTAVGMRDALGRLLIQLGASLHALLGQPFTKAPLEENLSKEEYDDKAEVVGQALATVAIAILSIVLLKKVTLVTAL